MLTAVTSSGDVVIASSSDKNSAPFYCPECHSPVTLKKGRVLTHHFAHTPQSHCQYGVGESEAHRAAKQAIYNSLIYCGIETAQMEKSLGEVRADIYAVICGREVAIEIQRSTLTPANIIKRTSIYNRLGIAVLWLALNDGSIDKHRFIPKWWEKWVHAAYMGKVFYWDHQEYVIPVKFTTTRTYIESTDFGGGYFKDLKRYKTPVKGQLLSLVDDFTFERVRSWKAKSIELPERIIFSERHAIQWETKK